MDNTVLLWILVALMVLVGFAGTILPALPGVALVFAGLALGAWIDNFARVGGLSLGVIGALALLGFAVDYLAAFFGAKRAGAHVYALIGAALGTIAGVVTGLWGLLFMPLVGAFAGQWLATRDARKAGTVGLATWLGMLVGAVAKIVIVCLMVGVFAVAFWV
jgi:uncharacterized protein